MGCCCTCSCSTSYNKLFFPETCTAIPLPFTVRYANASANTNALFSEIVLVLRSSIIGCTVPVVNDLLRLKNHNGRFRIGFSSNYDNNNVISFDDEDDNERVGAAVDSDLEEEDDDGGGGDVMNVSPENKAIISACLVGLFTGFAVVLFNVAVHELRDIFWDGIPDRGASWLREEPVPLKWGRVIFVPAFGGLLVTFLNLFRNALEDPNNQIVPTNLKAALEPVFKALAACVTLGTGNSLGPEGPSVDIGSSIARGVGTLFNNGTYKKLSLKAAGSAAGISSGFNAAVAGCFFAVESVLWPAPTEESSSSLTNTTSMVILSSVIASVVTEIGLGSEPAFAVPNYDFRSPSELPLYLLLGAVCGLVSVSLSRSTNFMIVTIDNVQKISDLPKSIFPMFGGLVVGIIALAYPEILYWGFQNVDILLESRPYVEGIPVNLLCQLVAVKIFTTSLCRVSGLVGGYYAPSLFIGAATGMAYGKVIGFVSQSNPIVHLPFLEVATPQAYGLVGMAATLAGVCQVPLTAVLLLFELTQDYRIVLPLLGAVGLSSWIASGLTRREKGAQGTNETFNKVSSISTPKLKTLSTLSSGEEVSNNEVELEYTGSLTSLDEPDDVAKERIFVAQAMRTNFVTVLPNTSIAEAVSLMLETKQPCAVVVDDKNVLIGLITLANIQQFTDRLNLETENSEGLKVSELCQLEGAECEVPLAVTPNMSLLSAQTIMKENGINEVPVVLEQVQGHQYPIGLLDNESIRLTCRGLAIGKRLQGSTTLERLKN